jgi:hypothetical protein
MWLDRLFRSIGPLRPAPDADGLDADDHTDAIDPEENTVISELRALSPADSTEEGEDATVITTVATGS